MYDNVLCCLFVHSVLGAERAAYRRTHIPMNINEGDTQVLYGVRRLPVCIRAKAWRSDECMLIELNWW